MTEPEANHHQLQDQHPLLAANVVPTSFKAGQAAPSLESGEQDSSEPNTHWIYIYIFIYGYGVIWIVS